MTLFTNFSTSYNTATGTGYDNTNTPQLAPANNVQDAIETLADLGITQVDVVADITARNALTPDVGDVAKVLDSFDDTGLNEPQTYIWDGSAWIDIQETSDVVSVNGQAQIVVLDAGDIGYSNAVSGLTATDVQAAIDEVVATAATQNVQCLTATPVSALEPGVYVLDSTGGAFNVELSNEVGVWRFSNPANSWSTNNVTILSTTGDTFTDETGAQVAANFVLDIDEVIAEFVNCDGGVNFYTTVDNINQVATTGGSGGLTVGTEVAVNTTATIGQILPVDVTAGVITVQAPAGAVANDRFGVSDSRENAGTNNITVDFIAAGYNLNGSSQNYVMNLDADYSEFIYINATIGWVSK